ncbi:MAG: flagellar hook-basal body complex protein FliE [Bdellovibrionota bacterium]
MMDLKVENLNGLSQIAGDAVELDRGFTDKQVRREMQRNGLEAGPDLFGAGSGSGGKNVTFSEMLGQSLSQVNEHQYQADLAMRELAAGRTKNIHETMLAVERADASIKLMMQVRNKILESYREIMRMQV